MTGMDIDGHNLYTESPMQVRSAVARASAFVGLAAFVFWVSSVLLELFMDEPTSWIMGIVCAVLSTYPVGRLFGRFSVSDAPARRMLARYMLGAILGYIAMAAIVFVGMQGVLLLQPSHGDEGDLLAALMAIWTPLWGLPFGGAMGMLRLSRRAPAPTP